MKTTDGEAKQELGEEATRWINQFFAAVKAKSIANVQEMLNTYKKDVKKGVFLNCDSWYFRVFEPAAKEAMSTGQLEIAQLLFASRCAFLTEDMIVTAIENGYRSMALKVLEEYPGPEELSGFARAFDKAVVEGCSQLANKLIELSARVKVGMWRVPMLYPNVVVSAIRGGYADVVLEVLENPNIKFHEDDDFSPALNEAVACGHLQLANMLIGLSKRLINKRSFQPLQLSPQAIVSAIQNGHQDVVLDVLKNPKLTFEVECYTPALNEALLGGHLELTKALDRVVGSGGLVGSGQLSEEVIALSVVRNSNVNVIEQLNEYLSPNQQAKVLREALKKAIDEYPDRVEQLLAFFPHKSSNEFSKEMVKIAHVAAERGEVRVIKAFIQKYHDIRNAEGNYLHWYGHLFGCDRGSKLVAAQFLLNSASVDKNSQEFLQHKAALSQGNLGEWNTLLEMAYTQAHVNNQPGNTPK